jgi:hypothetical protein
MGEMASIVHENVLPITAWKQLCMRASVAVLAIPRPSPGCLFIHLTIQHVDDVIAKDRKELPPVEGTASGEVECWFCKFVVAAGRVWGNEEVLVWSYRVPVWG